MNNMSLNIIDSVNKLGIIEPTFVASNMNVLDECQRLSKVFNTNYAYIEKRSDKAGSSIVICGHVNPNAVFITNKPKNLSFYAEDIELMWCAGADNIYFKDKNQLSGEWEFKKLSNPYLRFSRKLHSA